VREDVKRRHAECYIRLPCVNGLHYELGSTRTKARLSDRSPPGLNLSARQKFSTVIMWYSLKVIIIILSTNVYISTDFNSYVRKYKIFI